MPPITGNHVSVRPGPGPHHRHGLGHFHRSNRNPRIHHRNGIRHERRHPQGPGLGNRHRTGVPLLVTGNHESVRPGFGPHHRHGLGHFHRSNRNPRIHHRNGIRHQGRHPQRPELGHPHRTGVPPITGNHVSVRPGPGPHHRRRLGHFHQAGRNPRVRHRDGHRSIVLPGRRPRGPRHRRVRKFALAG
ncbi:hypothetical protein [Streptomyces abyssomicinicus]|uniref:hypothetical protein n=1 Tax=Streptomyces abyssomicinicus TaxID=574929 RepID=UPI001250919C|nr:hypothetical protein [Streptomyces abyssomicinicus]